MYERTVAHAARWALCLVFFWFGALKLFGVSPANGLVASLLSQTMPWFGFDFFIIVLGVFEMLIGILFLVPRFERVLMGLFLVHMTTTFFPLLLLPELTWQGWLTPTLEGQYIIKNVVVIVLAASIVVHHRATHGGR